MDCALQKIDDYIFKDCIGLQYIEFPKDIDTIGNRAFYNCSELKSIEIPNSVTYIGNRAFENCFELSNVELPSNLSFIGAKAFASCKRLESVKMPNNVTYIGSEAFYQCSELSYVEISNGVEIINNSTFAECNKLTDIVIPSNIIFIDWNAFGTESLMRIYCSPEKPPIADDFIFYENTMINGTLFIPKGSKNAYYSATPWRYFRNIIEIGEDEFPSDIENVIGGTEFSVTVDGNVIKINGAVTEKVEIYNIGGDCVYSGTETTINNLPKGIYIVRCGNKTQKIIL